MLAAVLCALFAGCGDGSGPGPPTLSIYLSLPLHGERRAEGRAVADGARLALAAAGGRIGKFELRASYLDDTGGGRRWSPVATAANARRAAQDSTAIGLIGDLDSGATRVSLPITNQAEIQQISPGSPALDLTGDEYRPSGEQTFARLVPNAAVLRGAATRLASTLGVPRGSIAIGAPGPQALRSCRAASAARYLVSPYRALSSLGPTGAAFDRAYRRRFGRPDPAAAYGYEAMALLLGAIRRAGESGGDRNAVRGEVLATRDRRSVVGSYSISPSGDTTLRAVAVYALRGCRLRLSPGLSAGLG